jgi:D-alanyl-lipoteichoic acid acyltransferase DltB (MBOAT superfamily)
MEITSLIFVLYAIISIILFYLINNQYRTIYLAILSCVFISSYSYYLLLYILLYSIINFCIGIKISSTNNKKFLFRFGILINLLQLIILRYSSFAIDPLFNLLGKDIVISRISEIIIPIGISYFSLQGIGYLINVKMGWEEPERNFLHFFLYLSFYPKFLSGPIERSNHFLPQLK